VCRVHGGAIGHVKAAATRRWEFELMVARAAEYVQQQPGCIQYPAVFLKGTEIYADPAAPSGAGTGAQELYQLLNAGGYLRAWVDGQDDVGHAALSN
jgi:hypothetical protein